MSDEQLFHDKPQGGPGYELADANVRQVVIAGLGIAAVTVLACFAMYFMFNLLKKEGESGRAQTINPMAPPRVLPPEPRLQEKPWEEMQNLNVKMDQVLTTYGWVNKNAGQVRIPINQAMDIVAQRGLPTRAAGQAARTAPMPPGAGGREGQQPSVAPRNTATPGAPPPAMKEAGNAPTGKR